MLDVLEDTEIELHNLLQDPVRLNDSEASHSELDTILIKMIKELSAVDSSTQLARIVMLADKIQSEVILRTGWWSTA